MKIVSLTAVGSSIKGIMLIWPDAISSEPALKEAIKSHDDTALTDSHADSAISGAIANLIGTGFGEISIIIIQKSADKHKLASTGVTSQLVLVIAPLLFPWGAIRARIALTASGTE